MGSLLPLVLLLLFLSLHPPPSCASPASCSSYSAAVSQNCYLSTAVPFTSPSTANAYTARYDCALALGYLLPCLFTTANASYVATYAALATTPCLLGRGAPSLVNHSQLTVVEVDSAGQTGLLSSYKHDNSTLNGNVGSCAGSALSEASAGVSYSGAACCSVDHALPPIAQQALNTIQAGISKSSYHLTPINSPVPLSATQAGQAATATLACPPAGLPSFPVAVRCNGGVSALNAQAALVSQLCYFNPLLTLPSPPPATLSTVSCALAWGEFALCQQALNNASAASMSAAAARLNTRAHVAVVTVSACGSSCGSLSSGTAIATTALLQAAYFTLTGVGNCVYTPPQLPLASPAPCISAAQSVQLYCQFNPRFILPTSLPPFLNKTECAVPFLTYAVCALSQVNQSGCNSQRSTPNVSLATALQPSACSFDSKLLPLVSRAITTVQTVNNTAVTATALRRVNGGLCSATPAAVFSSCMGLDVNAAVNTTGLACPSLACAVAYASYAACFLAQHPCTAPSPMSKYPTCPDPSHQVATFLSTCYSAVVSQSFTGYLHPPPAPLSGCSSTALSLFVANVQPTLSVPACSVSSLFGGLSAAVLATCGFNPLLASLPTVSSSCSVLCAWALTSYTQCQQQLLLSAINATLAIDSTLSAVQSRLLPVVTPSSSSHSSSSSLCLLGQSCSGDVHLVPYLSTCLASLQSLPPLSCPATVSGVLCTATPAAVSSACLGLNVANFTVTAGFGCPSRACAVAYTQYAACYLRQTPCHPQQLRSNGSVIGNTSSVGQACPDVQGQVAAFLSICYQAALSNAYTGYLFPPPTVISTRCNYTAITPFQQAVLAPNSPVLTAATPCTAATLFAAFAPAVQQDCYFNPLLSASPTYTSQCSPACSYALALYLRCYSALGNASANTLARTNATLTKGTPQPVVAPLSTSGSRSFTCGLGVACSFVVPSALQAYTATCLQLLQTTAQTCLPVPAAIVIPPAPTANLSLLSTGGCVVYVQPVLVSCALYVGLPIAFSTLYTRFPAGLLSRECALSLARYTACYLTAQPLQSVNASCTGACSLNQDVVTLARLAVAALQNASVISINPATLSLINVDQETCSSVAPQLPALCGVQLSAGHVMVNPGVLNCTLACAQQLTVYAECRLRSTAVCANRTYPVQGGSGAMSVTVPAYPSFPYPQASTNASVGQGRCVDVDGSLFAFLSFCNLTLTGNPPVPLSSSSSTAAAASSSLVSSSGASSSLSSSRFSSSLSTAGPTSAPYVTSSSPPPTYSFALLLTMMGTDFTVTINATLSCVLTVPPLYSLNSVFTVVAMTGIRSFTSLTGAQPNATSLITGVAPPGSYGGSDNSMYPLQPSLLDQNGLDYLLSPAAPLGDVAGTYGLINLYSSNGVYKEEAQGGGVEPTISSSASLLPLFPTLSSSSTPITAPPFVTSSPTSSPWSSSLTSSLAPTSAAPALLSCPTLVASAGESLSVSGGPASMAVYSCTAGFGLLQANGSYAYSASRTCNTSTGVWSGMDAAFICTGLPCFGFMASGSNISGGCSGVGSCLRPDTCTCPGGFNTSLQCGACASNYYGFPSCRPCPGCSGVGQCNVTSGACICPANFAGLSCSQCATGLYGPSCLAIPVVTGSSPGSGPDVGGTAISIGGAYLPANGSYVCLFTFSQPVVVLSQPAVWVNSSSVRCSSPPSVAQMTELSSLQLSINGGVNALQYATQLSFTFVASCPVDGSGRSCSGQGSCTRGSCVCTFPYYGQSCQLQQVYIVSVQPSYGASAGGTPLALTLSLPALSTTASSSSYQCIFSLLTTATVLLPPLITQATVVSNVTLSCITPSIMQLVPYGNAKARVNVSLDAGLTVLPLAPSNPTLTQFLFYGTCAELNLCSGQGSCQLGACVCYSSAYTGANCSIYSVPPSVHPQFNLSLSTFDSAAVALPLQVSGSSPFSYSFTSSPAFPTAGGPTLQQSVGNASMAVFSWTSPVASLTPYAISVAVSNSFGSTAFSFTLLVQSSIAAFVTVSAPSLMPGGFFTQAQVVTGVTLSGYVLPVLSNTSVAARLVTLIVRGQVQRSQQARTNLAGSFSTLYFPYSSDVGPFQVLTTTNSSVQASFIITGITLSNPNPYTSVTALPYQTLTFALTGVQNPSPVPLHNLTASSAGLALLVSQHLLLNYSLFFSADLADGAAANSTTSVLPAGQAVTLLVTVTFPSTVLYYSDNPTISIACLESVSASLVWTLQVQPPHPVLSLSPSSLSPVVSQQSVTSLSAQLSNGGSQVSGVIFVSCPAYVSGLPQLAFSNPNPTAVQPTAALVSALQLLSFLPSMVSSSYLNQTLPSLLLAGVQFGSAVSLPFQLVADSSVAEGVYTASCTASAIDASLQQLQSQSSINVRATVRSGQFTNLTFQVEDELTFFNASQPYVSGALISLSQLGISQSLLTNANGTATFASVPLGAYSVTVQAAHHQGVSYTILVTATTPVQTVFIRFTPVSYVFTVVPSLIADVITVTIGAVYNAQVPTPIVTISPNNLRWADLESGVLDVIPFTLSNLGLIDALNVTFTLTHPTLSFVFAINPLPVLPANSSVQIPVQVINTAGGSRRRLLQTGAGCTFALKYVEPCPLTPVQQVQVSTDTSQSSCQPQGGGGGGGGGSLILYGGGPSFADGVVGYGLAQAPVALTTTEQTTCHKKQCKPALRLCMAIATTALLIAETTLAKWLSLLLNLEQVWYNYLTGEKADVALATVGALIALAAIVALLAPLAAEIAVVIEAIGSLEVAIPLLGLAMLLCEKTYYECVAEGGSPDRRRRLLQTSTPADQTPFDQLDQSAANLTSTAFVSPDPTDTINLNTASNAFGAATGKLFNFLFLAATVLGDPQLACVDLHQGSFLTNLINSQSTSSDQGVLVSPAEYAQMFGNVSAYTRTQLPLMDRMVRRLNRTAYYNTLGINTLADAEAYYGQSAPLPTAEDLSPGLFVVAPANTQWDFLYNDQFVRLANQLLVDSNATQQAGFSGLADELTNTGSAYNAADAQAQQGVCASVSVQLTKQTLTAEREDFLATLTIDNTQSTPLTSLSIALVLTLGGAANASQLAAANLTSNSLFSIQLTSTGGLASGGVGGDGTISAGGMGTIVWTVLPYAIAAPSSSPALYSVSGQFSYAQDGVPYTVPLLPATITVFPTPVLVLDYFLPSAVYSDDPFTAYVEPSVPFAVGLLASNVGYGSLLSLTLQSSPPTIVDNARGLLISFSLLSTALNDATAATTAVLSAGNVAAGGVLDYRDIFSVSLMGTFVAYNLTLSESLASGDARLALVQQLRRHLLVQTVYIPSMQASAYLCQELPSPPQASDPFSIPTPDTLYLPVINSTSYNLTAIPVTSFLLNSTAACQFTADLAQSTLNWTVPVANQSSAGPVYYRCAPPAMFPVSVAVDPLYGLPQGWTLSSALTQDGRTLLAVNPSTAVGNVWLSHRFVYPLSGAPVDETYLSLFDPAQPAYTVGSLTYTVRFSTVTAAPPFSSSSTSSPSSSTNPVRVGSSSVSSATALTSPSVPSPSPSSSTASPTSALLSSSFPSPMSSAVSSALRSAAQSTSLGSSSLSSSASISSSAPLLPLLPPSSSSSSALPMSSLSSSPPSSSLSSRTVSSSVASSSTYSSSPFTSSPLSSSAVSSSPASSSLSSSAPTSSTAPSSAPSSPAGTSSLSSSPLSSSASSSSSTNSSSILSSSAVSPSLLSTSPLSSSAASSSPGSSSGYSSSAISSSALSSSTYSSSPVSSSALSSSASTSSSPASSSLSSSAASSGVASSGAAVSSGGSGLTPSSPPGASCASAVAIYPTLFAAGLPPPLFWLSASTLPPNSSRVNSWPDLTFRSNDGSSSSPPLYMPSAYAGLPAVRFGGLEDVQLAPVQPLQADWTAMLVLAVSGEASSSGYVLASRASPDHSVLLGGDQLTVIWYSPSSYGVPSGGPAVAGSFPVPVGVPFVLTASYSFATQLLRLYIDGRYAAQIGYSGAVDSSLSLANGYWYSNNFAGDVMEALLFDEQLDDAPRAYLEQTLLHLYNGSAACAGSPGQGGVVGSSSGGGGGGLSAASIYRSLLAGGLPSPLFWLSASSIPVSTTVVDTWLDLTPAAHTAISRAPPTLIPNAHAGLPAVRFNGSQELQAATVQPSNADWSAVLVIALTRAVSGGYLLASRQTNYRSIQLAYAADGPHIFFWAPAGGGLSSIPLPLVGVPYVLTVTFDSTAQLVHMYVNGQQAGAVTNTGNSDNTLDLANGYYPNNQYAGDMMEVIFFDHLLQDAQRGSLEQQLMQLYQL